MQQSDWSERYNHGTSMEWPGYYRKLLERYN